VAAMPRRKAVTRSALEYHHRTSYDRHDMTGHGLDWPNQPNVFKSYPGLRTVPLPEVASWPQDNLSALIRKRSHQEGTTNVTLEKLAQIIRLTHSLTAKARMSATAFYYRSVASAGALYPCELYAAVHGIPGLDDGLYHHSIGLEALTALRSGNMMPHVSDALRAGPHGSPMLFFFLTSIFFRSSWKYRDRAYRYHLLDTGHLAENLLLALRAQDLAPALYYDFDDETLNGLLGVDPRREVCLAVICVRGKEAGGQKETLDLKIPAKTLMNASRVSAREVDYALIRNLHTASCRVVEPAQEAPKMLHNLGLKTEPAQQIPRTDTWPELMNYAGAVFKRRSRRNFVQTELPVTRLDALLELLCATEHEQTDAGSLASEALSIGLLTGNVQDLNPGFYVLDPEQRSIALSSQGFMTDKMAHVCLDQAWLANSALHFVFLTNLRLLDETWGPRGYRYAMLIAGRLGQRIYLATTAMGIGCCGIGAFYDDEAAHLLGLNEQTSLLYLVAAGPLKR
jgi:SagB-type dehydrogenase family enzyme